MGRRTVSRRAYKAYINSDAWRENRSRIRAVQTPQFCYCCGERGVLLELHHKSYKSLGNEISRHMAFVCRKCHQDIHDYAELHKWKGKKDLWRATKKVRKRNGGLVAYHEAQKLKRRVPTVEVLANARYTKAQLAQWGVPWPPPKGWKKKLGRLAQTVHLVKNI